MRKVLFISLALAIAMLFTTVAEAAEPWYANWFEGKVGTQWRFNLNGGEDEVIYVYTRDKRLNGREYKEILESPPFLGATVNDPFLTFRKNNAGVWGYGEYGNEALEAVMLDILKKDLVGLKGKVTFDDDEWLILPHILDTGKKFDTIKWNLKVWDPINPWKVLNIKHKIYGVVEKIEEIKLDGKADGEKAMKVKYSLQISVGDDKEEDELMTFWIAKKMGLVKVAYPDGDAATRSLPQAVEATRKLLTTWGSIKAR